MPHFAKFPDNIDSWTTTREMTFRMRKGELEYAIALAEVRMLERLAAIKLGISGNLTKTEKSQMESEAQAIYNDRALPANARYMKFVERLLDIAELHMGHNPKAPQQIELLCKFIHKFNVDDDVQANIANEGGAVLFKNTLHLMVTEGTTAGFTRLPAFVFERDRVLNADLYRVATLEEAVADADLDALTAFLRQAPLITPARTAVEQAASPLLTVAPPPVAPPVVEISNNTAAPSTEARLDRVGGI